ncbi:hypothetical protein HD596_005120 [Nonomuraea jabiensis]|uniref:Uncharacterized protein n=1 Tax=Nonomuraea jabiensis TaxID=882448 RepID=A0A7W9LC55_9ACTN|nr:hypothetical protein [Nonomuraea jabiensis]
MCGKSSGTRLHGPIGQQRVGRVDRGLAPEPGAVRGETILDW